MRASALVFSAALALAGVALTACEPCSGVVNCDTGAHVSLSGRILDDVTGAPVAGVTVDLVRTSGVTLASDSTRTRTDADGLFTFTVPAATNGDAVVDVVVRGVALGSYRVRGVRLTSTQRRGDGRVLPAWSTWPRLPDLATVYRRGHPRTPLAGAQIEFQQTGGPPLQGLTDGVYRTSSGDDGWFLLFGSAVRPTEADEVVGDLVITHPALPRPAIHRDVRIPAQPVFRAAAALRTFGAGPSLEYHFAFNDRGTVTPVAGVRVQFQRTDGIRGTVESWEQVTGPDGRAVFEGYALDTGVMRGTLTVTPPSPFKAYQVSVELPTFDHDTAQVFGVYGVGPGLPYYVIIRNAGVPMPGVTVEFQRTSGIVVTPGHFAAVTNDSGMAFLTPDPETEGDVLADVTVRPPAPRAPFTVRGLRLTALDADRPGGRVLLGDWDVTAPPSAAP